jgi:hypothetical protein
MALGFGLYLLVVDCIVHNQYRGRESRWPRKSDIEVVTEGTLAVFCSADNPLCIQDQTVHNQLARRRNGQPIAAIAGR